MFCHSAKAKQLEHRLEYTRLRGRKFNKLETIKSHRIFKQIAHQAVLMYIQIIPHYA